MDKKDVERVYKYLEDVQLAFLKYNGIPLENYFLHEDDLVNFPERYRDAAKDMILSRAENIVLPTKYEIDYSYQMLKDCVDRIDNPIIKGKVAQKFGIEKKENLRFPIWGTVTDFEFDAAVVCPDASGTKLVIISNGVFTSANLLIKIIDNLMFSNDKSGFPRFDLTYERMEKYLDKNYILQQRFNDFVGSMLFCNTPIFAKQYFDRPSIFRLVMLHGFETFVVAHEYAHSLCGHIDQRHISSDDISKTLLDDTGIETIYHQWEDEFEADTIGAYITLEAMSIEYPDFSKWIRLLGVYLCMKVFELQDKIKRAKLGKDARSKSHPPGTERKKRFLKALFPEGIPEFYDDIDLIFNKLWISFYTTFIEMAKAIGNFTDGKVAYMTFPIYQKMIYKL